MAVVHTSRMALPVNGEEAYAYIAQPNDEAIHPGVVLIQEWWGIEPHVLDLANKLAEQGFVVAVPDLYEGQVATEPNDAMRMIMMIQGNIDKAVNKVIGALNTVKNMPNVEPKKMGLIGFCVGGFVTYKTAERYPDLAAVVPFYGAGYDPTPQDIANVNAPILAIYGSQDQSIPQEQTQKIEQEYKDAGKDITVKVYDAGHAFINPTHGMGNEAAAADAWPLAINFLREHLQ